MTDAYRSLFVGSLLQESFLSIGGTDDPDTTVDSPFCRDGQHRPTLRGTGLAGALIATLRRLLDGKPVPEAISGSQNGRQPSVWRFFNSHQPKESKPAYRQHVAIDARTGAAASGALFNAETLPPKTKWSFLLEVDTAREERAAEYARKALAHWAAGRCLIGREVARGLGWMRLEDLQEYQLTTQHVDKWPFAEKADDYPAYVADNFKSLAVDVAQAQETLPRCSEISGYVSAGEREDDPGKGYGIDSLSVGGHASEELAAAWDARFLAPDGMIKAAAEHSFDPDFAVVTLEQGDKRLPYIPGSSLRGPLRHALARLLRARGRDAQLVQSIFGSVSQSAKLLIRDAMPDEESERPVQFAWLQHHAEDEFAGGAYSSAKFDRVAVMQGRFAWKMVLEDETEDEMNALEELFNLAQIGQIGIGGGQWRGHGWLRWHDIRWSMEGKMK
jgi:CRISPR/Cas system CSM-associated protein Csm3 (group 7 of RAMP superfamily)